MCIETGVITRTPFHLWWWCSPHSSTAIGAGVVVPLVRASTIGKISFAVFNPAFKILGTPVVLHPLEMVSVPVEQLGEVVASLSEQSQSIMGALDELLSCAWK
jgi:toxin CcdB